MARIALLVLAATAAKTDGAKFERVQHGLRDGGVQWGDGVHFDNVELEGSDGEKMEIDHDLVTEDAVVKGGKVTKDYLAGVTSGLGGFAGGVVETVANLPEPARGSGGIALGAGSGAGPVVFSPARRRLGTAPVPKKRTTTTTTTTAAAAAKDHGPERQIAAALAAELEREVGLEKAQGGGKEKKAAEQEGWEREIEAQKQTHVGLQIGRIVWVAGLIALFLPRARVDPELSATAVEMTCR